MQTIILDPQTIKKATSNISSPVTKSELPPIQVRSEAELDAELQTAISQLELLPAGKAHYLSADKALETAAAILLGVQGIQTESDYLDVQEALDRVCATCGFGSEVELNPPTVSFSERGRYRQKIEIDETLIPSAVESFLSGHTTLMGSPYHYIPFNKIEDKIALEVFGKDRYCLNAGELKFLELTISTTMAAEAWQTVSGGDEDGTGRYLSDTEQYLKRGMKPDLDRFKKAVGIFITLRGGDRLSKDALKQAGCRGTFAPNVTSDPDNHIPASWWHEILKERGYMSTCRDNDGWLYPIPLDVPDNINELIAQTINQTKIRQLTLGKQAGIPLILADEIVQTLGKTVSALVVKTDRQMDKTIEWLETNTNWSKLLIQAGYNPKGDWASQHHIDPPFKDVLSDRSPTYYLKMGSISKQSRQITLADGLRVNCLDLTRDNENNLVYMRMIGPRSSVNANWAVVRGRRSIYCLDGGLVPPAKASALTLKSVLPESGWDDWIIIHHQASLEKMIPGQPFYCTGEGYPESDTKNSGSAATLQDNFFMRLTKSLSTPLLGTWASYLWSEGIDAGLIIPLEENCHGLFFWQVNPDGEKWSQIVEDGLKQKQIHISL